MVGFGGIFTDFFGVNMYSQKSMHSTTEFYAVESFWFWGIFTDFFGSSLCRFWVIFHIPKKLCNLQQNFVRIFQFPKKYAVHNTILRSSVARFWWFSHSQKSMHYTTEFYAVLIGRFWVNLHIPKKVCCPQQNITWFKYVCFGWIYTFPKKYAVHNRILRDWNRYYVMVELHNPKYIFLSA